MKQGPLVSVIMPTFNRADRIGAAIDSVLRQTYTNVQLIVSDDGSTDGTAALMASVYPAVAYRRSIHGGQSAARNNGLALAKGSIIASLDSDDTWFPDFLECCVTALETAQLDFVFTNWIQEFKGGVDRDFLSTDKVLQSFVTDGKLRWQPLEETALRALYLEENPSPSSATVIRRSSMPAGWNESIQSDDWCLMMDMVLPQKRRGAFTLEPHWNKFTGGDNLYDGRRKTELLQLYQIDDTLVYLERFKQCLAKAERAIMKKRCVRAMVELAKYRVTGGFRLTEAVTLLRRATKMDAAETIRAIPDLVLPALRRRWTTPPPAAVTIT